MMMTNIIVASPASPALPTIRFIRASFASPIVPVATFVFKERKQNIKKEKDDDERHHEDYDGRKPANDTRARSGRQVRFLAA